MNDEQIIALYEQRLEQAITCTNEKYGRYCNTISMNILNNASDAEECVNDTYLKAWDTIPPTKPNPLNTYIGMLVRRISINRYEFNRAIKRNGSFDVLLSELEQCLPGSCNVEEHLIRIVSSKL